MKTTTIIKLCILAAVIATIAISFARISSLAKENLRLHNNQAVLLSENNAIMAECRKYRVSDSLNAYKVSELRLTVEEYEKFRSQDLELIRKLKLDKSDMQKVIDSQSETIYELTTQAKDTTIIVDSAEHEFKTFDYNSKWIDVTGRIDLANNTVSLDVHSREELTIVESVERKRFLGFLWKTNKVIRRDVDVISKNPNTEIVNVDYVSIETK